VKTQECVGCEVSHPTTWPSPDAGLVFFFLRLPGRLQSLGTVPAIDLLAYSKSLES